MKLMVELVLRYGMPVGDVERMQPHQLIFWHGMAEQFHKTIGNI